MTAMDRVRALASRVRRRPSGAAEDYCGQEAEDAVLERCFPLPQVGFYVEVGAFDPVRFSNTLRFYRRGWRGIVIDPRRGFRRAFSSVRPRDIALECGVSEREEMLTFYTFGEPAMNTFAEAEREAMVNEHGRPVEEAYEVACRPLSGLLADHLPPGQKIDFLSVDAEGFDLRALRSNDWSRFRPGVVLAEDKAFSFADPAGSPVYRLMRDNGYDLVAKTRRTAFYEEGEK